MILRFLDETIYGSEITIGSEDGSGYHRLTTQFYLHVTDTKTDLISSSRTDKIPNNASVNYSNDIEKNDVDLIKNDSLIPKSTAILPLATSPSSSSSQTRSLQPPSSTKEEIITKEITINFNDTGSENNNNNSVIVENTDGNNKNRISLSPSSTSSSSTITALSSSSSTNSIINQTTDPSLPVNSTTDQQQLTVTDSKSVQGSSDIASTTDDSNKNVNGANNHNVFDPSIGNHSNSSSSPNVSDNNKTEAIDENIVPTDYNSSSSNHSSSSPLSSSLSSYHHNQQQNQINNQDNNQTTAAASENHSFPQRRNSRNNNELYERPKSASYNLATKTDSINGNNKVYKKKSFDQLYKDKQISASSWKEKTNTNSSATSSKNKISQSPSDNSNNLSTYFSLNHFNNAPAVSSNTVTTFTNNNNATATYADVLSSSNNNNNNSICYGYSNGNGNNFSNNMGIHDTRNDNNSSSIYSFNIELSRPKSPKGTNTRSHTPSRINNNNEGNTSLFSTSDHISLLQIGALSRHRTAHRPWTQMFWTPRQYLYDRMQKSYLRFCVVKDLTRSAQLLGNRRNRTHGITTRTIKTAQGPLLRNLSVCLWKRTELSRSSERTLEMGKSLCWSTGILADAVFVVSAT
ncbi:8394_t:CDS:2 [Entrophospora sp. SA101]|nr:8394_t:CDS:2 [Entrophospora sp. SA101]